MRSWWRTLRAELPLVRDLPELGRPLPRVGMEIGPSVPGWALRLAAMAAAGALPGMVTARTAMAGLTWVFVLVPVVIMALWPAQIVAQAAILLTGILLVADGRGPFDPVAFALIPLAPVAVRLTWWAERVTLTGRVEVAALVVGVRRWCAVVGGTVALAGVVYALGARPSAALVVLGGIGIVALSWLVFVRLDAKP